MECDISKMCLDLKDLLEDICTFFSNEKLGKLSPRDKKLAESLINRSKKQLQEISKIKPSSNEDYVIMNNQVIDSEKEFEQEHSDIYSSVDDINNTNQSEISVDENPYKDLPAKDASDHIKSGWLFMKKRFLLGFEKTKRIYGTIHNNWLLVYLSEKDLKPLCTINLKHFTVKEYDGKKSNFELLNTKPNDNKVYHFIALTHKDMLQWTTKINLCHDRENNIDNPNGSEMEYSNTNENFPLGDEDPNQIYEVLTTVHKRPVSKVLSDPPDVTFNTFPKLNPRLRCTTTKIKAPVKVPPPVVKSTSVSTNNSSRSPNNSSESLVSYHEIFSEPINTKSNSNSTKSLEDSFSDNSEDSMYETFVYAKQSVISSPKKGSYKKKKQCPPALPLKEK